MEQMERIGKLKESERKILSDIFYTVIYLGMALFVLFIINFFFTYNVFNPVAITIIISVIGILIYTLAVIYLIGLAVTFGTIHAKRVLLKAEIDAKDEAKQESKKEEE